VIIRFTLNNSRIDRLHGAGIYSIRDLAKVLASLDMEARVELEELRPTAPAAAPTASAKKAKT